MAFLDNSGDIILDVVLTDEGRKRLAQGDGTFMVEKFALGDDEINYALYNNTGSSGTQDLQILQTPILEAFTNNYSSMKSTLMTYGSNNLFHLPILKLNTKGNTNRQFSSPQIFMVAVDHNTSDNTSTTSPSTSVALDSNEQIHDGFLFGADISRGNQIRVDAGIDNIAEPPSNAITDPALRETSYEIKIDHRLGSIVSPNETVISYVEIDDDNVATYVVTSNDTDFVRSNDEITPSTASQVIVGSRSTYLSFKIASSSNLRSSYYMFNLIGSTTTMISPATHPNSTESVHIIDSIVRVTGQVTGYSIDIPVRFVKNAL